MARHTTSLMESNALRHRDGAARQVERARAALPKLSAAPADTDRWRPHHVLDRYVAAVQLRIDYPGETVAELARRWGLSKGQYWSILRRALLMAETLPDDEEWVIFK